MGTGRGGARSARQCPLCRVKVKDCFTSPFLNK